MKNSKLFWAIFFLGIGVLVLLHNLGYELFNIDIKFIVPSLVILWGAFLIIKEKTVRSIIAGFNGFLLALLVFGIFQFIYGVSVTGFKVDDSDFYDIQPSLISKYDTVKYANLNFDGGLVGLLLREDTKDLVSVSIVGNDKNYSLDTEELNDSTNNIDLSLEGKHITFANGKFDNKVKVGINQQPIWNLDIHGGLSSFDLDLTKYKINELNMDIGLSSVKLKLGAESEETNISIDGGLSSIEILVPEEVGCQIETDNGLTETVIKDFQNVGDDRYQSYNFNESTKKIYIKVKAGLSSLNIRQIKKVY